MSEEIAVRLSDVGKMYKIYPSRLDNFLDAMRMTWIMPWRRIKPNEFWALRNINFELKKGSRLGIIGRNGAGKSTLLKLITGNLALTEGHAFVNGKVQALLEAGTGFHPEFTGHENIRASLTYQGFNSGEIEAAIEDIAEFTELGQFLSQPFKTYSAGMQARLIFATATTLKPDILIVDEILGAGDAYFAGKSSERMKQLVEESGASVMLVSHATEQILRYCDACLWLERGKIVRQGPALDVVKAYEAFIHALEDRRLKAKNRKRLSTQYEPGQLDLYSDAFVLTFQVQGGPVDICEIAFEKDGAAEDILKVGDVQDTSWSHAAVVALDHCQWSAPRRAGDQFYRSLIPSVESAGIARGIVVFYAYTLFDEARYVYRVRYRCPNSARLSLTITRNGRELQEPTELPFSDSSDWLESLISLKCSGLTAPTQPTEAAGLSECGSGRSIARWPSEGSAIIEQIELLGPDGREQTVFPAGGSLTIRVYFMVHRDGSMPVLPSVAIYRIDGILVSRHPGQSILLQTKAGEKRSFELELDNLNLGDGHYLISVALFKEAIDESQRYDLLDRSYEFQIVGNEPLMAAPVFHHPSQWRYNC